MNSNMERKPNVILINCDDMGYGDLGCYGSKVNHTPTIDKLAEEGALYLFLCGIPGLFPFPGVADDGLLPHEGGHYPGALSRRALRPESG